MFLRNTNLHIRRFEFKYLVPNRNLDKIRNVIKHFTVKDPNANSTDNSYAVYSTYFDDYQYTSFYEKEAGIKGRKKYRLRSYTSKINNNSTVFLEIKRRDENVIFKDRCFGKFTLLRLALNEGQYDAFFNNKTGYKFLNDYLRKRLHPVITIAYLREAYFDKNNLSFRITLDQNLVAGRNTELNFKTEHPTEVIPGYTVLEAKFNRIMPAWFGTIIKPFNLNRISFSKYCFGMESCGIVPKTKLPEIQGIWI